MRTKIDTGVVRTIILIIVSCLFATGFHCAGIGHVSEKYPEDFYKVHKLFPDEPIKANPRFIVYSDNQNSWRVKEKFLKKSNWSTWNMLIFPFYQLYLLGNGVVGTVNWLRHNPDYGARERRLIRDAIYAEAKRTNAAFILNIGDIAAHDGRRPAHWATFIKENRIERPLLEEIPYLPVIGNHEHANDITYGLANYQAVFDYRRFYVVEFKDAALFVLDSNFIIDQSQDIDDDLQDKMFEKWFVSKDNDQEASWLEKQLSAYDKTFKMVAMHHPPISYGKHHQDWSKSSYGRCLIEKRQQLLRLFKTHGVQVVLSGHDHLYQHYILRYDTGKQTHFIVGGGGGSSLRSPADTKKQVEFQQNFNELGLDVLMVRQEEIYHYYLVEMNSTELTVKVLEVTEEKESPPRLVENIQVLK